MTRVLLVDDEPDVRHSVSRSLQVMGYHVDVAADGAEDVDRSRPGTRMWCCSTSPCPP
jgi:CheY-like chemotaxis protein